MPEPVSTIAGLGLGVLGSYLANRVDDAQRPLLQLITARLQHPGAELPPNHDVANSCRNALRQAIEMMAQHPKKPHGLEGRFKDPGIARLLKSLAQSQMPGLCVVTTREPLVDLQPFEESTVREVGLQHLTVKHGAELLHLSGANRAGNSLIDVDDPELLAAAREVRGHALTLHLLGGYLRMAHGGDIRRRDRVDFSRAFEGQLEGHAYNVMAAYERWFEENGTDGQQQLAALRLTGLFDRPADAGCLQALRDEPPIAGLTDTLTGLDESDWNATLRKLEDHGLLTILRDPGTEALGIDAHPLVREYFGQRMKEGRGMSEAENSSLIPPPSSFQLAHRRLYEHLCATTPDKPDATLEDLQPLYQAVAHGCQAGLQQEADEEVYYRRITRGDEKYAMRKLGAFGSELGALACFFEQPWSRVSSVFSPDVQGWYLHQAAFRLRALGRLTEALEPMRVSGEMDVGKARPSATAP